MIEQTEQIYKILTLLFGTSTAGATLKYFIERRKTKRMETEKTILTYENLLSNLLLTRKFFVFQGKKRNALVKAILRNHKEIQISDFQTSDGRVKFDEFFGKNYPILNEKQLEEFKFIRGINETLFEYNSKVKDILSKNLSLTLEVPKSHDLLDHINIWLVKYNTEFKNNQKQCLVYVGPRGKPFPKNVENDIKMKIEELKK